MLPSRTRYITGCQQALALAVVVAALTPAASVISLEIVHETPAVSGAAPAGTAYARPAATRSVVPTEAVDAVLTEYPLTAPVGRKSATTDLQARTKVGLLPGSTSLRSVPQAVTGYGAVGITWDQDVEVSEEELSFSVRTRSDGAWSDWAELDWHDDHAPDPDSPEAGQARPGTDALIVGDVDEVQISALSAQGTVPADLRLAVVDPGEAENTAVEAAAIDTAGLEGATDRAQTARTQSGETAGEPDATAALQAATSAPQPVIYSRAQWGADERLRDKESLRYGEVNAGFVHHTVNANDYTPEQVPAMLRSIYAYHTQSRGWSDVGYNFLVDRFGRIWEGRAGGIDRPVVGAHTLGYNDYTFAMSAIGNFDITQPSAALVEAYGALMAWKLSLHGVDATSMRQMLGSESFPAINGHRDAGSTACPGRYLYAKLGAIRELAGRAQSGGTEPQLEPGLEHESDLASTPHPDLVVRRASDGQGFVIPTGGLIGFQRRVTLSTGWSGTDSVVVSPDLTGDGRGDLLVRRADGTTRVHPGTGTGGFGAPVLPTAAFAAYDELTAVGDIDGDGRNDIVARKPTTGRLDAFLGNGSAGFVRTKLGTGWDRYDLLVGPGDVTGDGRADILARDAAGALWLHRGTNTLKLAGRTRVPGSWNGYESITGRGDYTSDGTADLFVQRASDRLGFVLPGRGDGTFGHALGPVSRVRAVGRQLSGGQLTGTAAPEVLGIRGDRLVLLRNNGTFDTGRPIATGANLSNADLVLNAGDWDRDGHGDIITRGKFAGRLFVRRGDGDGHFGKSIRIGTGFGSVGRLAPVGDMTGDGFPDLMGQPASGDERIYPGNGLDGFEPSYVAPSRAAAGSDVDLAPYDWVIRVSAMDLTGPGDVIVRERATGNLWVLRATADGFRPRRFLGEGMQGYDLAG